MSSCHPVLPFPRTGPLRAGPVHSPQERLTGWRSCLQPSMLVILALAAFYGVMFQKYRAYDIDNPWFLSFAYNLATGGSGKDVFLGMSFPAGMDGTFYFGKLAAYALSAPLAVTGWLPRCASLIVISFVTASLALWRCSLARWGMPQKLTAVYLLVLGLTEPVLTAAEKFRYEFFAFFLFSLAVWLAARRRGFLALFIACVAVETEPAAIVCPLVVLLLLVRDGASLKRHVLPAACAAALAFGLYELLHPRAIPALLTAAATRPPAGYRPGEMLAQYFVTRPRHLADLIFLLTGYALWRRSGGSDPFQATLTRISAVLIGVMVLCPHANAAYMIFPMPILVLLALRGYWQQPARRVYFACGAFVSVLLVQYGALYYLNYHEGFSATDIDQVQAAIARAERQLDLDDSQVRIVGDYSVWFAHPRHFSAGLERAAGDLYLCFDQKLQQAGLSWPNVDCGTLRHRVALRDVSQVNVLGHELRIMTPGPSPRTSPESTVRAAIPNTS